MALRVINEWDGAQDHSPEQIQKGQKEVAKAFIAQIEKATTDPAVKALFEGINSALCEKSTNGREGKSLSSESPADAVVLYREALAVIAGGSCPQSPDQALSQMLMTVSEKASHWKYQAAAARGIMKVMTKSIKEKSLKRAAELTMSLSDKNVYYYNSQILGFKSIASQILNPTPGITREKMLASVVFDTLKQWDAVSHKPEEIQAGKLEVIRAFIGDMKRTATEPVAGALLNGIANMMTEIPSGDEKKSFSEDSPADTLVACQEAFDCLANGTPASLEIALASTARHITEKAPSLKGQAWAARPFMEILQCTAQSGTIQRAANAALSISNTRPYYYNSMTQSFRAIADAVLNPPASGTQEQILASIALSALSEWSKNTDPVYTPEKITKGKLEVAKAFLTEIKKSAYKPEVKFLLESIEELLSPDYKDTRGNAFSTENPGDAVIACEEVLEAIARDCYTSTDRALAAVAKNLTERAGAPDTLKTKFMAAQPFIKTLCDTTQDDILRSASNAALSTTSKLPYQYFSPIVAYREIYELLNNKPADMPAEVILASTALNAMEKWNTSPSGLYKAEDISKGKGEVAVAFIQELIRSTQSEEYRDILSNISASSGGATTERLEKVLRDIVELWQTVKDINDSAKGISNKDARIEEENGVVNIGGVKLDIKGRKKNQEHR
jgi:hypothetical protein